MVEPSPQSRPKPQTALARMQKSRKRTDHAYSRARNNAERAVVHLMIDQYPAVYASISRIVAAEAERMDRAVRQSRVRSACASWFREEHCPEWVDMLDAALKEQTAATGLVIHRRKGC